MHPATEKQQQCEIRKAAIKFHQDSLLNGQIFRVFGAICTMCGDKTCEAGKILIREGIRIKNLCCIMAVILTMQSLMYDKQMLIPRGRVND